MHSSPRPPSFGGGGEGTAGGKSGVGLDQEAASTIVVLMGDGDGEDDEVEEEVEDGEAHCYDPRHPFHSHHPLSSTHGHPSQAPLQGQQRKNQQQEEKEEEGDRFPSWQDKAEAVRKGGPKGGVEAEKGDEMEGGREADLVVGPEYVLVWPSSSSSSPSPLPPPSLEEGGRPRFREEQPTLSSTSSSTSPPSYSFDLESGWAQGGGGGGGGRGGRRGPGTAPLTIPSPPPPRWDRSPSLDSSFSSSASSCASSSSSLRSWSPYQGESPYPYEQKQRIGPKRTSPYETTVKTNNQRGEWQCEKRGAIRNDPSPNGNHDDDGHEKNQKHPKAKKGKPSSSFNLFPASWQRDRPRKQEHGRDGWAAFWGWPRAQLGTTAFLLWRTRPTLWWGLTFVSALFLFLWLASGGKWVSMESEWGSEEGWKAVGIPTRPSPLTTGHPTPLPARLTDSLKASTNDRGGRAAWNAGSWGGSSTTGFPRMEDSFLSETRGAAASRPSSPYDPPGPRSSLSPPSGAAEGAQNEDKERENEGETWRRRPWHERPPPLPPAKGRRPPPPDMKDTFHVLAEGGAYFTLEEWEKAQARCRKDQLHPRAGPFVTQRQRINPRGMEQHERILIRNVTVWDGLGGILEGYDVLMHRGIIQKVKRHLGDPNDGDGDGEDDGGGDEDDDDDNDDDGDDGDDGNNPKDGNDRERGEDNEDGRSPISSQRKMASDGARGRLKPNLQRGGRGGGGEGKKPPKVHIVEGHGRILTPGIIDMHSHAGVSSYPDLEGTEDTNDWGNPTIPQMRSIDAFNPHDKGLPLILSGGITTILALPGSANLMGGEAFAFKTPQPVTNSVEDMLLNANASHYDPKILGGPIWRWSKQACGENPKRGYGEKDRTPFTRMGNAFSLRQRLEAGARLRRRQDDWCRIADVINAETTRTTNRKRARDANGDLVHNSPVDEEKKKKKKKTPRAEKLILHPKGHYPTSIELEQVVALLRGKVRLNWHCYEVHDLEAQIRTAREFDFPIAAFHHALDIYQVLPLLARWEEDGLEPIGAAIFADHWGYKKEAYQASVYAPQTLRDAGVPFAFKSDHPVLNSQYLVHESAKSIQYGLDEQTVLRALTSVPAKLMGVDYRIGSIRPGMDADVVLWPTNPFQIGSLPDAVYVDGFLAFEKDKRARALHQPMVPTPMTPIPPAVSLDTVGPYKETRWDPLGAVPSEHHDHILVIRNVGHVLAGVSKLTHQEMRIERGKIACLGKNCTAPEGDEPDRRRLAPDDRTPPRPSRVIEIDLKGGTLTPPLVLAGTQLGIVEIAQEPSTRDGTATTDDIVHGRAALQAGGHLERAAANQGVGLGISAPSVRGTSKSIGFATSVLFATNHSIPSIIAEHPIAVHAHIGHGPKHKDAVTGSVSGQIRALRMRLLHTPEKTPRSGPSEDDHLIARIRDGELPLVLHVNSANHMAALLDLKRDIGFGQRWVFAGAAEAHLILGPLKEANRCNATAISRRLSSSPSARSGNNEDWSEPSTPCDTHGVGVLLQPARCVPSIWDTRRCLSPPYVFEATGDVHVAGLLRRAGIPFALSTEPNEMAAARNLRFDAGWVRRFAGIDDANAMVRTVSTDVLALLMGPKHFEAMVGRHAAAKTRFTWQAAAAAANGHGDSDQPQPPQGSPLLNDNGDDLQAALGALQVGGVARFNAWNGDLGELETQLLFSVDGSQPRILHYPVHQ